MINLLPDEQKKQIRAARLNIILVRYNFLIISLFVFLFAGIGFAYYYLSSARQLSENAINENVQKEGEYAAVKTEAENFRKELASAKTILDGQVSYAKAALNIARLLPEGTSVNSLKLSEQSFTAPIAMTVNIANEEAAINLLNSFRSSPLFSNVTKGKISVVSNGTYPYTMELTVTMSKAAAQ